MSFPYAFARVFEKKEPFLEVPGEYPKDKMDYLLQPGNMKGLFLGQCLDACRWGSMNTVMWDTDVKGMIDFIQNWMSQNKDSFEQGFHEKEIDELYSRFELPFIHHEKCPRQENHKRLGLYSDGTVRCIDYRIKDMKPSLVKCILSYDKLAQCRKPVYLEHDYDPDSDVPEEDTEEFWDVCFSVISDKGTVLPLEATLRRLNLRTDTEINYCGSRYSGPCKRIDELPLYLQVSAEEQCPGHKDPAMHYEVPMDGWTLAFYVQKWHEQCKDPPFFGRKGVRREKVNSGDLVVYKKR